MGKVNDKDYLIKYLERYTIQVDGCWIFIGGSKTKDGYRRIMIDGKVVGVHRLSAYIFNGLDLNDKSKQANHKIECSSKTCWNPQHIYVGTHEQNIKDYNNKGHYNTLKTHCKRGHELDNRRNRAGKRSCRVCDRIRHHA